MMKESQTFKYDQQMLKEDKIGSELPKVGVKNIKEKKAKNKYLTYLKNKVERKKKTLHGR